MMQATVMKFLLFVSRNPARLIVYASSNEVVIFDISAGWNRTGPNSNQDLDPFTSTPRKMTATSSTMTIK